jgi:mannose-6-phosphate isomerase-like protein (cupin superfamily)
MSKEPKSPAYTVGDSDTRPWGSYTVVATGLNDGGEEFCEKEIIVNPGHILSLQSHASRKEHWVVRQGTLTVVVDGARLTLEKGQDVKIPKGGLHCMANLGTMPCIVKETQLGLCREDDITRYMDAYGRGTQNAEDPRAKASIAAYLQILAELKRV